MSIRGDFASGISCLLPSLSIINTLNNRNGSRNKFCNQHSNIVKFCNQHSNIVPHVNSNVDDNNDGNAVCFCNVYKLFRRLPFKYTNPVEFCYCIADSNCFKYSNNHVICRRNCF